MNENERLAVNIERKRQSKKQRHKQTKESKKT